MRPVSIIYFERLYAAALAIGLVSMVFFWELTMADVRSQPGVGLPPGLVDAIAYAVIGAGYLIALLLWFFIARRASSVAKWIWLVLFGLSVLGVVVQMAAGPEIEASLAVDIVVTLIEAIAAWMLFRPDARAWFAGRPASAAIGEVFD